MRTRIATVGYLNAKPLTEDLDRERYEVIEDHPAAIADRLHRGDVDVALVPVASVLRDPGLRVVPGYAIGAEGPATSVLLVAETPPAKWERLVLDGVSRTSAALTRVLLDGPLAKVVGPGLVVEDGAPGVGVESARGTTAALVIGDVARVLPERLGVRIDLAELWAKWTGLPFVFAVWAGRAGLDAGVIADLRAAAAKGLAARATRFSGADLDYLTNRLRYDLDDRALMGLRRYAALGHRMGLFPSADVTLFGPAEHNLPRALGIDETLAAVVGGQRLSVDGALRLEAHARLADLAAAAEIVRYDLHDAETVRWIPEGRSPGATVRRVEADELPSPADLASLAGQSVVVSEGTAVELASRWQIGLESTLAALAEAGVASLRGGLVGKVGDGRLTPGSFLELAEEAHEAGLEMVIPLVVGLGETPEARWAFLERARALQDRTGGFAAVVVRPAEPGKLNLGRGGGTAVELLRFVAVARLFFDNVDHVEAPWMAGDPGLAQAVLHHGGDSLGVVSIDSDPEWLVAIVERDIRDAGWEPVRVDGRYAAAGGSLTARTERRRRLDATAEHA